MSVESDAARARLEADGWEVTSVSGDGVTPNLVHPTRQLRAVVDRVVVVCGVKRLVTEAVGITSGVASILADGTIITT